MKNLFVLFTTASFVSACATQTNSNPEKLIGPETVKFESTPTAAKIQVNDPSDNSYSKSCVTPCQLVLETTRSLNFQAEKTGYVTRKSENIFYRNPKHEAFSRALIKATTGKSYSYGPRTIKTELLTPEQTKERKKQKAKEIEAKRKSEERIALALSDNTLAQCGNNSATISNPDKTAQPLVRVPPIMPPDAERSGHCRMKLNVNKSGKVSDAIATYCTDEVFLSESKKSVMKWVFVPKRVNDVPVSMCGVETKISFILVNESGSRLPE